MGYRNYSTAVSHIVDTNGQGDFTTIGAALTAASSGQTIVVRPGTYTENLTLKAGIDLVAFDADAITPNVIINGKCTATFSGTASLSGICLQTNSDFALSVTGSAVTNVYLKNCYINALNNNAIQLTSSASSVINLFDCKGNIATTGIAYFTCNSAGGINFFGGVFQNGGGSSTASTCSNSASGAIGVYNCFFANSITTSNAAALTIQNCQIVGAVIVNGTGTSAGWISTFSGGSSSAISVGAGAIFSLANSTVDSTNTNAITGAGTLKYGGVVFTNSSSTINTVTQTPIVFPIQQGGTAASSFNINGPVIANTTTTGALASITLANQQFLVGNTSAAPTAKTFSTKNQVFTSTGTYTPTAGMVYCTIESVGGGGGGGGTATSSAAFYSGGGGGGGGGYARIIATAATIGASQTVTIGAAGTAGAAGNNAGGNGGDTSVGVICVGKGGTGGSGSSGSSSSNGGAGGVAGTGDLTFPGTAGGAALFSGITAATGFTGPGGNSYFGAGAPMQVANASNVTGTAGSLYGGGGSGGVSYNNGGTVAGGAGAKGLVIIQEYIIS